MDKIYLIKTGTHMIRYSNKGRKVIAVFPDKCFVVQRHEKDELSIWTEGLTAKDGYLLAERYSQNTASFGHLWESLMKENANNGLSERGFFTREGFSDWMSGYCGDGFRHVSDRIYDSLWETPCGVEVL